MTTRLNRAGYQQLIDEDVAWLERIAGPTLEREHIIAVLKASVEREYGPDGDVRERLRVLRKSLLSSPENRPAAMGEVIGLLGCLLEGTLPETPRVYPPVRHETTCAKVTSALPCTCGAEKGNAVTSCSKGTVGCTSSHRWNDRCDA